MGVEKQNDDRREYTGEYLEKIEYELKNSSFLGNPASTLQPSRWSVYQKVTGKMLA